MKISGPIEADTPGDDYTAYTLFPLMKISGPIEAISKLGVSVHAEINFH